MLLMSSMFSMPFTIRIHIPIIRILIIAKHTYRRNAGVLLQIDALQKPFWSTKRIPRLIPKNFQKNETNQQSEPRKWINFRRGILLIIFINFATPPKKKGWSSLLVYFKIIDQVLRSIDHVSRVLINWSSVLSSWSSFRLMFFPLDQHFQLFANCRLIMFFDLAFSVGLVFEIALISFLGGGQFSNQFLNVL